MKSIFLKYKNTILFKIFLVTLCAWLISMTIAVVISIKTESDMNKNNEASLLANANMVKSMLHAMNMTMTHNINKIGDKFLEYMTGSVDLDESKTVMIGEISTPVLSHNGKPLNLNFDAVDKLTKEMGAVATIFAKKGDDYVRISTSLKKEDGKSRAIGTLLGHNHPAFQSMNRGESYIGRANLFGKDYMTKYIPIRKDNKTIGIFFVGVDFTSELKEMLSSVRSMKFGESGYFFIVDGSERTFGRLVVHPSLEGKNIADFKTPDGKEVIKMEELKEVYKKGIGKYYYPWLDKDNRVREMIAIFTVYEPWKLGIAVTMNEDEFAKDSSRIKWLLILSMWLMNIIITISVVFAVYKQVTKPASSILNAVNRISSGDLTVLSDYKNKDEMGRLSDGINDMLQSLRAIIKNILDASEKAGQMVESLKQNASNTVVQVKSQTEQANTIALNSSEMSKTIGDIANNAEIATNTASKSVETAGQGLAVADQAVSTIERVNESTTELAIIVEGLQKSSTEISDIVTVIKDIADQTNLLALNAAIEAARAGEQGRGFAVVADEVRKLAEKTIHATTEISSKINSIQQEVMKTKTSMESATSEVNSATGFINNVGNVLKEIVGSIEESKEQMTRIAAAVVEQSATTEEVAKNIDATASISKEVEQRAINTMKESDNLLEVINKLKETTRGFKI